MLIPAEPLNFTQKLKEKKMFYATNKLRHSTYFCTPSDKHNKAEALLLLSLSVLHLFSYPLKQAVKACVFFYSPFLLFYTIN